METKKMMAGKTDQKKYVCAAMSGVVRKATPSFANPSSLRASSDTKPKISYPALVLRTKSLEIR